MLFAMRHNVRMKNSSLARSILMNDGWSIPQIGLGVFQMPDDEVEAGVLAAIDVGYRHFDTARIYRNEEGLGRALRSSGLPRDEFFVTTKLWNREQGTDSARQALHLSLRKLQLEYVDLYLIHWPAPARGLALESWQTLIALRDEGLIRSIGVSNFLPEHLDELVQSTGIVPAVNQVELHPAFQQADLREVHASLGVVTEAWGPLGQGKYDLAEMPVLATLARTYDRSVHAIALRWHLQCGTVVIPKTSSPSRMIDNASLEGFELTPDDMAAIADADRNARGGTHPLEGNW